MLYSRTAAGPSYSRQNKTSYSLFNEQPNSIFNYKLRTIEAENP